MINKASYKRNCEIKAGITFPPEMQRICLGVEYKGTAYRGFQKQATANNTVQAALEKAISTVANEAITTVCAGRTDAGVHASEQVLHFDTVSQRPDVAWVKGVNCSLPDDIRIYWSRPVSPAFHARFSALARTYQYVIYSAPTRPAVMHESVCWTPYELCLKNMQKAAEALLGEHDFSTFRASQCQARSPVRCIYDLTFKRQGAFLVMTIRANAFLHHMVRNIVGTLMEVGRGAKGHTWPRELLGLRDRTKAAVTSSPSGLYLVKVDYSEDFGLPQHSSGPVFLR